MGNLFFIKKISNNMSSLKEPLINDSGDASKDEKYQEKVAAVRSQVQML